MKFITPSVEIMRTGLEKEFMTPEQFIEKVGRTCYKSEDKITEDSAAAFTVRFIKWGHESVLEHWNLIFKTEVLWYEQFIDDYNMLIHNGNFNLPEQPKPFLRFTDQTVDGHSRCIISGNMRAWRDYTEACINGFGFIPGYLYGVIKNYPLFFPEYKEWVPVNIVNNTLIPITASDLVGRLEHDIHHTVTVRFTCDRGVTHEIVRHRTSSYAQESTRYCNYSQDKFGAGITIAEPEFFRKARAAGNQKIMDVCYRISEQSEQAYLELLDLGCTPQEARFALITGLKTELIMTATLGDWEHFFFLRDARDAHPDIRFVASALNEMFKEQVYTEEVMKSICMVNDFAELDEVIDD